MSEQEDVLVVDLSDAPPPPPPPPPPKPKGKRGRPKGSVTRNRASEAAYAEWLRSPPEWHVKESAMANRLLAALRVRAREVGFKHGPSVAWIDLARKAGIPSAHLALMLRGRQRLPVHVLCIVAEALGMKVELVADEAAE